MSLILLTGDKGLKDNFCPSRVQLSGGEILTSDDHYANQPRGGKRDPL